MALIVLREAAEVKKAVVSPEASSLALGSPNGVPREA